MLWVLNNHFLSSTRSNQIALITLSLINIGILGWISFLSLKSKLVLQSVLTIILIILIILGTAYLYLIFNIGDAINHALQNANFDF